MRSLRVAFLFFRVSAMNELQYRTNFFVAAFQSVLSVGVALVVLKLVYSHTNSLNGWTQPQLLCVLGIQILLGGIVHAAIQPNMQRLVDEVRDGKLDFVLTKPEDPQAIVSVRQVEVWQAVDVISGAIVLGFGIAQLQKGVGITDALAFAVLLLVGGVLLYCFWLVMATGAFWVVNMWFLAELFEGIYQTGKWPIGVYPSWLRYSMTYLVPIGLAITVPAQAVTSRLTLFAVASACGFAVVLFVFARWFWNFGLRRYSGASA